MIDIGDGMEEYASVDMNDVNDIINEISFNWFEVFLILMYIIKHLYSHSYTSCIFKNRLKVIINNKNKVAMTLQIIIYILRSR